MALSEAEFDYVRQLVYDGSSIVLEPSKHYLVETRLIQLAREIGLQTVSDLIVQMRTTRTEGLQSKVVEAMTTNETSFFRDIHPFEALKTELLPKLVEARKGTQTLNIWSAACSTGQEAYTIGMVLREHFPACASWKIRILCTDLSRDVLAKAKEGRFSQLEVNRGMPATLLVKYFKREGLTYVVTDELRSLLEFRELNLAKTWSGIPAMDIVFLRNVLIYFDVDTKKRILAQVRSVMRPDAVMLLGGAETTINLDDGFQRIPVGKASCYRLKT